MTRELTGYSSGSSAGKTSRDLLDDWMRGDNEANVSMSDRLSFPERTDMYTPSEADAKKLEVNFVYHAPFGDQPERYAYIRAKAKTFAELLLAECPPSRELSLAITKLEECMFWANSSIARHEVQEQKE